MTEGAAEQNPKKRRPKPARGGGKTQADPEAQLHAYADRLQEVQEEEAAEVGRQWVSFHVGRSQYALPVDDVQEVLRVASITRVPHSPAAVRGVTNLRGRVLPVVDLARRLGGTASDLGERSRILVARYEGRPVGLLVDAVEHMRQVLPSKVQEVPEEIRQEEAECLVGVCELQGRLIALLNAQQLLNLKN